MSTPAIFTRKVGLAEWFRGLADTELDEIFGDDFTTLNYDDADFASSVAHILNGISSYGPVAGFSYSVLTNTDGSGIDGFEIQQSVEISREEPVMYVGRFHEERDMTTDRTATGIEQAYAIVDRIAQSYAEVCAWTERHVS